MVGGAWLRLLRLVVPGIVAGKAPTGTGMQMSGLAYCRFGGHEGKVVIHEPAAGHDILFSHNPLNVLLSQSSFGALVLCRICQSDQSFMNFDHGKRIPFAIRQKGSAQPGNLSGI